MYIDLHTHTPIADASDITALVSYRPSQAMALRPQQAYSLGLHPYYSEDLTPQALEELTALLEHGASIVAIGEAGLDRRAETSMAIQTDYLRAQIALSERHQLPLVLHVVHSWGELLGLHRELRPSMPWIVHGFRRGTQLAESLIRQGLWLSFGEHHHPESLSLAYARGRMLLETDASTIDIRTVYAQVASQLGIDEHTLAEYIRIRCSEVVPKLLGQ